MVTLTKLDIELALDRIDTEGIPTRNRSTGYCLEDAVAMNSSCFLP